jgi:hypothetical protein
MKTNEIRMYLHSYRFLDKEIQHLSNALDQYRKMGVSDNIKEKYAKHPLGAQVITDDPVHHSNVSKTESLAMSRLEYIEDLEEELDGKMRLRKAIEDVYFYLHDPALSILEMRYFMIPQGRPKYSWREIAMDVYGAKTRDEIEKAEKACWKLDGKIVKDIQLKLMDSYYEKKKATA